MALGMKDFMMIYPLLVAIDEPEHRRTPGGLSGAVCSGRSTPKAMTGYLVRLGKRA